MTSLDFCGLSRQLVGFVGLLVVDEDVGRACSLDPVFQDVLVLGVRKGLLKKRALDVTRFKSNFIGLKNQAAENGHLKKF